MSLRVNNSSRVVLSLYTIVYISTTLLLLLEQHAVVSAVTVTTSSSVVLVFWSLLSAASSNRACNTINDVRAANIVCGVIALASMIVDAPVFASDFAAPAVTHRI